MQVKSKDGHNLTIVQQVQIEGQNLLIVKLPNPTYVCGVVTSYVLTSPHSLVGITPQGEHVEVVSEENTNNERAPLGTEVPSDSN